MSRVSEIPNYFSLTLSFHHKRSEKTITIEDRQFYLPRFLSSGVTMKRAQEICDGKGMMLFEPRDASINRKVWQAMKNDGTGMYWVNLRRDDPSKDFMYDSDNTTPQYTHWAPGMFNVDIPFVTESHLSSQGHSTFILPFIA